MKKELIKNIYAMFAFAIAMVVVSVTMVSCSEYDGPEVPNKQDPEPPQPQVTIERVEKIACNAVSSTWDGENAVLMTRGISDNYAPAYRTNAWWAVTNTEYQAKLIYTDGTSQEESKYFNVTNNANVFLGKGTQFVKSIETIMAKPEESITDLGSLGELTVYEFEGYSFGIVTSSQKSPEVLTFDKISKNDLCTPQMTNTYLKAEKHFVKDSLEYKLYDIEFHFQSMIEAGDNNQREVVITKRFAESKNGTTPGGNDPEHVCYVLRNSGFDFVTEETSKSYATVYEIFSDGSEKKVEDINTIVYNWHKASEDYELIVSSFAYTEVEDIVYRMVADGTSRVSDENANIFLTGYQTTALTGTQTFTYRFDGHFEIPVYTDPDGKAHTMEYREYNPSNNGLKEGQKTSDGVFETLPVTSPVTMEFNQKSYDLESTVTLKVPVGNIQDRLSGLKAINIRVEGEYIKYDLVRYFTQSPSTTTPMEVLHMAEQHAEELKTTEKRSYTATSTQTDTISSTPFTDGRHTGDYVEFNKTYHYADFDVVVNNKVRQNIVYTEGGFTAYIYAGETSCNQNGYTFGTVDNGDDKKHVYTDEIAYGLNIGAFETANSVQLVQYSELIPEEKHLVDVKEVKVEGNRHFMYITFSDGSFDRDTVTVEKPVALIGKTLAELNRSDLDFGKGQVDHSQKPAEKTSSMNGRVVTTPYEQTYPVSYNNHNHSITGTYEKYYYAYTYKGVTKGCDLTSPSLKVENTNFELGTAKEETVGNKVYKVTPVTFNYKGTYGSQNPTCKVTTSVRQYLRDVEIKKILKSVEEIGTKGDNIHYIKITFDDNSFIKDTVTVNKPVTLVGGTVEDMYRDDVNFGKGVVNSSLTPTAGTKTTNGRVTATAYTHNYPVAYNGHDHKVTGTYNKYIYTYTHEGVSKSCNLTTPTLKVENTSVVPGTGNEQTIGQKIYEVIPVVFNYTGTYGSQTKTAKVTGNVYKFVKNVEDPKPQYKTEYSFVAASRVLSKDQKTFHNCYLFKACGEENGLQIVIPDLGVDYFCDASTIGGNMDACASAIWNGTYFIPCEVLVDNSAKMFAYDGKNTSGDKYLLMSFNEAVIKGIKNYSSDINTSATPIMNGISSADENGVITVYLNKGSIFTYHSGKN